MEQEEMQFQWKLLQQECGIVVSGMILLLPLLYAADVSGRRLAWGMLFLMAMLFVSAMDYRYGMIFDRFLVVMGLAGVLLVCTGQTGAVSEAFGGAALGGGFLLLVRYASAGGMGGGDVKYAAVLGLWLGWKLLLLTMFLSFLAGSMAAAGMLFCCRRKRSMPFGPFLSLGAGVSFLWGEFLLEWYMGWFP